MWGLCCALLRGVEAAVPAFPQTVCLNWGPVAWGGGVKGICRTSIACAAGLRSSRVRPICFSLEITRRGPVLLLGVVPKSPMHALEKFRAVLALGHLTSQTCYLLVFFERFCGSCMLHEASV